MTEALKLHSEALLAVKSLLDRVESVDKDFQEFGNRNDMERARLGDAAAATILQVEEHGYLEEAEVLRFRNTTFDFGNAKAHLTQCFRNQGGLNKAQLLVRQSSDSQAEPPLEEDPLVKHASMHACWASLNDTSEAVRANPYPVQDPNNRDVVFSDSDVAAAHACQHP